MKTNRRKFISTAAIAGGAVVFPSCNVNNKPVSEKYTDYSKLDEALKKTVLKS